MNCAIAHAWAICICTCMSRVQLTFWRQLCNQAELRSKMATPRAKTRATSTTSSFYGSSSSTPASKGPKPKRQRLGGLNLVKSLRLANDENLDDLGIDLSSDDEHSESANNQGGGPTSPPHDPTDLESGEDDPHMGEGLELSFNSSMYSFEDPASLTDHSSSLSVSRSSTPASKSHVQSKKAGSGAVTPQYRIGTVESHRLADMLDRQNNLILELLNKHEQLSTSLQEVRSELRETKETVGRMVQETKASSNKDDVEKMKRKYPSSLTVSIHSPDVCAPPILYVCTTYLDPTNYVP